MTRRRRAALLLGLALLLGTLAASDVAGREAALRRALGPPVAVLVTRTDVPAGARLDRARLAIRRVPARYASDGVYEALRDVAGLRAAVAIPAGTDIGPALVADPAAQPAGPPLRPGERIAEIVAAGSPALVVSGGRVDVLVTRETGDGRGSTTLALEDAAVVAAAPAPDPDGGTGGSTSRVAVSLRVSVRQAVYLAAAQSFARELRVLPRAAEDHRRGALGSRVSADLGG